MSMTRVLRGLIFGALGGVIGWFIIEFLVPALGHVIAPIYGADPKTWVLANDPVPGQQNDEPSWGQISMIGSLVGVSVGFWLGLAQGMHEGTTAKLSRATKMGALLGLLGGFMGMGFGQAAYQLLGGDPLAAVDRPHIFAQQLIARSVAWAMIGLFLGLAVGLPGFSLRRAWNGALGGFLGGLLGGFVFQALGTVGYQEGPQLRGIGFMVIGASVGLFINLVAEAFKRTWVKVLVGRNEGRDHVLDRETCVVGRDELVDVPVFLDPATPKRQAVFRLEGSQYALYPEPEALPMAVNGELLQPGRKLVDGDAIQFGRVTLAYYDKVTYGGQARAVAAAPGEWAAPPGSAPLMMDGATCPYCGQPKDPHTGACACSVPGGAPAPTAGWGGQTAMAPDSAATIYSPAPSPDATQLAAPPDAGGQGPRLVGMRGPYAGLVYDLPAIEVSVGREEGRDIELSQDSSTSRHHADLAPIPGGFVLRDAGSANGTFVNGQRVQEHVLRPGDQVQIGNNVFQYLT